MAYHDIERWTFPLEYVRLSFEDDGTYVLQDCPECGAIASVERGEDGWHCRSCALMWPDSDELSSVIADDGGLRDASSLAPLGIEVVFDELADPRFRQEVIDDVANIEPDPDPPL